jgi:hypothetical protein
MIWKTPVHFHLDNFDGSPFDALSQTVAITQALNCFVGSMTDLQLFQNTPKSSPVTGLSFLLEAISDTVDQAAHALYQELNEARSEADLLRRAASGMAPPPAEPVATAGAGEGTDDIYPKVSPSLSARDAAIAATLKAGYDVKDIARAVNLKQQTVEKIIARLRGEAASLDEDPGDADRAVNE